MLRKINTFLMVGLVVCIIYFVGIKSTKLDYVKAYEIKNLPKICGDITLGGFSDMFYKDGYLYAITDRGPNGDPFIKNNQTYRVFPCPEFHPKIIKLELKNDKANVIEIKDITDLTGLPISKNQDSTPININKNPIKFDINGADTEAFIIDKDGNYWIGDEYYPSLIKLDKNLKVIKRFAPKGSSIKNPKIIYNLPDIFNNIDENNGFESISYDGDETIYIFTQSILKHHKHVKVLQFNIKTEQPKDIKNYVFEKKSIISGSVAIDKDTVLLAERIFNRHFITKVNLKKSVLKGFITKPLKNINGINEHNKIEGLAFDGKDRVFLINDNDFGQNKNNRKDTFILEFKIR